MWKCDPLTRFRCVCGAHAITISRRRAALKLVVSAHTHIHTRTHTTSKDDSKCVKHVTEAQMLSREPEPAQVTNKTERDGIRDPQRRARTKKDPLIVWRVKNARAQYLCFVRQCIQILRLLGTSCGNGTTVGIMSRCMIVHILCIVGAANRLIYSSGDRLRTHFDWSDKV